MACEQPFPDIYDLYAAATWIAAPHRTVSVGRESSRYARSEREERLNLLAGACGVPRLAFCLQIGDSRARAPSFGTPHDN